MPKKTSELPKQQHVVIKAPSFEIVSIGIRGTSPLVAHKFSFRKQQEIAGVQALGDAEKRKRNKVRAARNFEQEFNEARYISREGWDGIPCAAFRSACIRACTLVDFKMTIAKMTVFILADGFDKETHVPLVRIHKSRPVMNVSPVANADKSLDLRSRPMYADGWEATVRIRYDTNQFSKDDVAALMARVGMQVGILQGRASSPKSAGCGWGEFELI
jgi:hypothetical protein